VSQAKITTQELIDEVAVVANELAAIEVEGQRRIYAADPELWAQERLGITLWSGQRSILRSIRDNRRTAVYTCHEIGKTLSAAIAIAWWIDIHPVGSAFAVTTAPTGHQVRGILWREIGRVHARGQLRGRMNQTEWWIVTPLGNEEMVAIGRKPDEYQTATFQGFHQRYLLFVGDEACGIPLPIWVGADSLIGNDNSKALAIGNPDDPKTEFGRMCKPGSGWNTIQIGAFDTPNFTGEDVPKEVKEHLIGWRYVEDMRKRWARSWSWSEDRTKLEPPSGVDPKQTNPYFQSKVLGLFPEHADANGLIPLQWITTAQVNTLAPFGASELGVDVGAGGDSSTICHRKGPMFRIVHEDHNPDTMHTTGEVVRVLVETEAELAKVDVIGIGRGVVDRGKEQGLKFVGVNVGQAPIPDPDPVKAKVDEKLGIGFANLRAQLWWNLRTMFENENIDIDIDDEELAAELVEIRYFRNSSGKIQVESKQDMISRGVPSPNRADAVMLAAAPDWMLKALKESAMEGVAVW
jgi:hypothetical protein